MMLSTDMGGLIYEQMPKAMAEVGAVGKTRRNPQQGYMFRGIDEIYYAVQGVFAKHGIFVVPTVEDIVEMKERTFKTGGTGLHMIARIRHRFYAADGSFVDSVTLGEAMDTGDKTCNKVMSVAMKYALVESLCIPTEGKDDPENESHELAPRQQTPQPTATSRSSTPAPAQQSPPSTPNVEVRNSQGVRILSPEESAAFEAPAEGSEAWLHAQLAATKTSDGVTALAKKWPVLTKQGTALRVAADARYLELHRAEKAAKAPQAQPGAAG